MGKRSRDQRRSLPVCFAFLRRTGTPDHTLNACLRGHAITRPYPHTPGLLRAVSTHAISDGISADLSSAPTREYHSTDAGMSSSKGRPACHNDFRKTGGN